jgi:chromosome partitioning protein
MTCFNNPPCFSCIGNVPQPRSFRFWNEVRPQLKLLPNSIDIEAADLLETKKVNRELLLRRQLKPVLSDFDVVLIDTLPAMRAETINALVVADTIVIPIDSSGFVLLGMNS